MSSFPAVLRPALLSDRENGNRAVYYSFRYPTLLGPVRALKNQVRFMQDVQERLDALESQSPDFLGRADWTLFQSQGPLRNKRIRPFRTRFAVNREIEADFHDEIAKAKDIWGIQSAAQFFPAGKKGFLSRFIRISRCDQV
jgi:hypothetical protein